MNIFKRTWEQVKAWRRGERMIAGSTKGRCFVKKANADADTSGAIKVRVEPKISLAHIRVIRADGSVEEIK